MKIGIIGHESAKFTPEGEQKARDVIRYILLSYKNPILVSGRCPIAECENCHRLKMAPTYAPIDGYFECPLCHEKKAIRKGGVDIFAESMADELRIPKEIKIPQQNKWDASYGFKARNIDIATVSGEMYVIVVNKYAPDYIVKPWDDEGYCFHCDLHTNQSDGHEKSGACYTGKYFEKLHGVTKAHWVIINQKDLNTGEERLSVCE